MKVLKWLDKYFEEAILIILLVTLSCVELVQVVIRNIPWVHALTWPEEFCRFCWIWSVFISVPYTVRNGLMLRVSVLMDMLPGKLYNIANLVIDFINLGLFGILFYFSIDVIKSVKLSGELSPAMEFPMWIVYSMMVLGFFLAIVRGIQQIVDHIKHFNDKHLSTLEQTMADAAQEASLAKASEGGDK